jgi:hypothetical protein
MSEITSGIKAGNAAASTAAAANNAALAAIAASLVPIPTPVKIFLNCENGAAKFGTQTVGIPANSILYVTQLFAEIAETIGQFCTIEAGDAILSIPEYWENKLGYQRPQLIFIYREKNPDGSWGKSTYPISVPHPKFTTANQVAKPTGYEKGNFNAILTLTDNSKVIAHAKSETEARRIIDAIKPYIADQYLTNIQLKLSERTGATVFVQKVVQPWRVDYWSKGLSSRRKPDWSKLF